MALCCANKDFLVEVRNRLQAYLGTVEGKIYSASSIYNLYFQNYINMVQLLNNASHANDMHM